jgi:1-acyl-sn-glycerol-3-phosphate acyltransferase
MLKAKKSVWFEKIFAAYNSNLISRRFNSLQVSGLDFLHKRDKNLPLILFANHSSWWDGLVAFQISRKVKLDSFLMMEEKQLRKLRLFRKIGAFSVVREKPREALKSIVYAADILREKPNRVVWIFPQGEILPNDIRPLGFYNGLTKIIKKVGICSVIPVAMRFEFLDDFKPDIFVKIGEPNIFNKDGNFLSKKTTFLLENKLTETLDFLKTQIVTNNLDGSSKYLLTNSKSKI